MKKKTVTVLSPVLLTAVLLSTGCNGTVRDIVDTGTSLSAEESTNATLSEEATPDIYSLEPNDEPTLSEATQLQFDCVITNSDFIGSICSDYIATVHLNAVGSYSQDSDVPAISGSEITVKDLDGNLVYQISLDSTVAPQLLFDQTNNLHVYLSDMGNTEHIVYDTNGEKIESMCSVFDYYVYPENSVFDINGYFYSVSYDWSSGADREIRVYAPDGSLFASKSEGSNVDQIITMSGIPYIVKRNTGNVSFIPVLEYVQNLEYDRILADDVGAGEILSANNGFFYIDYSDGISIDFYDITTGNTTPVIQNIPETISLFIGNENIIAYSVDSLHLNVLRYSY